MTQEEREQEMIALLEKLHRTDLDDYVRENVVLGLVGVGEPAPFERWGQDLGIDVSEYIDICKNGGSFIVERDLTVHCEDLDNFYRKRYFNFYMSLVFDKFRIGNDLSEDELIMPFPAEVDSYIRSVFPLFLEALNTEVEEDAITHHVWPSDKSRFATYEFLCDVYENKVKFGDDVGGYFEGCDIPAPYVVKLIKEEDGKLTMRTHSRNGLAYKFALLGCISWYYRGHENLYFAKLARLYDKLSAK